MPSYEVQTISDSAEWDAFITGHPEANFLHSWQWGEYYISRDRLTVRRGVYSDGELVGVYVGAIETARRGIYMAIAGGPIIDWHNKKAVNVLFADIKNEASRHSCVFVRVRPQLEKSSQSLELFRSLGLRPAPMHLSVEHAGVLDLTKSEEDILKEMRTRLKRALRKAEKYNIQVSVSDDPNKIDEFYDIQLQTAKRHGFVPFGKDFLKKQFAAFASTGNALLYTAIYEGEILAQNFMIFYGEEASYHYGVSTEKGTQMSGAPLLHMAAMREARARGCSRYNFWGIVEQDDIKHRFYGVSVFKRGFGVQDLYYIPTHDLVLMPARYSFNWLVESVRRKHRSL